MFPGGATNITQSQNSGGNKEWQGVSADIMESTNKKLTDFIFASDLLKQMRAKMMGEK